MRWKDEKGEMQRLWESEKKGREKEASRAPRQQGVETGDRDVNGWGEGGIDHPSGTGLRERVNQRKLRLN